MKNKGFRTRKKIIEKSLNLFSLKGYFSTSISDIVEATGLTKGGLYGHFKSKEDIWYAVYEEAVKIWKSIVFKDLRDISDPLERIEKLIENQMRNYLGADVFEGGCFFINMLAELSGQSTTMRKHIVRGFLKFGKLLRSWLEEADQKKMLKEGLNLQEIANFMSIAMDGAATLYSATREPTIWKQTITQLHSYTNQLKRK